MTTKTKAFRKVIRPGTVEAGYPARRVSVFVKIEYTEDGRLSLSGVVGPRSNGDCWGSCGQCADELDATSLECAPGWTPGTVQRLRALWDRWHLNDRRAGCEHQRAAGWEDRRIDPTKPRNTYGCHFPGQKQDSWNMLTWVTRAEHPAGLLSAPCPACGYDYGSKWLREEVPADVLDELRALPESDTAPAWV